MPITCETAPHYIALSDEALLKYGTLAKMNPPLRSEADRKATIEAIADGTVDLLATDHAPHTLDEKRLGFLEAPNGIIGLECAYGVCHKVLVDGGFISDKRLIELMSTEPMKLMGHAPTDITALLDAQQDGTGEGNRVLDLRTIGDAEEIGLAVLDTAKSWTVDPGTIPLHCPQHAIRRMEAPVSRLQPSSANPWHSAVCKPTQRKERTWIVSAD